MKFATSLAVLVSLVPNIYGLTVDTPAVSSLAVCEPIALTWSNGTAPYYLTIIPGGNSAAAPLETFAPTNDTSMTWTVDIAAGISISLALKDSTGQVAYSDAVTIRTGADPSCVTVKSVASASATAPAPVGSATGNAAPATGSAAATGAAATPETTKTTGTTTAASGSASKPSASNGASRTLAMNSGVAGILSLLGFALL